MAAYQRLTALSSKEAVDKAAEYLTRRIPLEVRERDAHAITLAGGDGVVTIEAHRHGMETVVVATTDRVRTSRIDLETQNYLNQLPYQPGDVPTR